MSTSVSTLESSVSCLHCEYGEQAMTAMRTAVRSIARPDPPDVTRRALPLCCRLYCTPTPRTEKSAQPLRLTALGTHFRSKRLHARGCCAQKTYTVSQF